MTEAAINSINDILAIKSGLEHGVNGADNTMVLGSVTVWAIHLTVELNPFHLRIICECVILDELHMTW